MQLAAAPARLLHGPAVAPAPVQRRQHRLGLAAGRCPAAAGGAPAAAAAVEAAQSLQEEESEELLLSFSLDSSSDEVDDELQLASKPRRRAAAASGSSSERRRRGAPLDQYRAVPVTVAGQRYESLMDLRYKMRSLQRELVSAAPRGWFACLACLPLCTLRGCTSVASLLGDSSFACLCMHSCCPAAHA